MDKQKLNWVTWAVLAIAVLLVALMLGGIFPGTPPPGTAATPPA